MEPVPAIRPSLTLPALSESDRLRYLVLTALYASQGVPYGLLIVALPAYLARQEVPAVAVAAFIGGALLPASLKVFYGPIMDRWSFLPMGRRRPWVLFGQAGLALSFLALSFVPNPVENLAVLTALGFVAYFFTMFQDVATDGMAVDVVPVEEQPRANGFMWGGVVLGGAATTAGGAWALNTLGFGPGMVCAAALVVGLSLFPLLFRERPGERLLPWSAGRPSDVAVERQLHGWADIGRSLWRVIVLPASLIGGVTFFTYGLTRGIQTAFMPLVAVQELGWTDTAYSNLNATASLVVGVIGMTVGGWMAMRVGRLRFIRGGAVLFALMTLVFAVWPALWPYPGAFGTYIALGLAFDVLIMIAFLSVAMALCGKRVAATQFAVYMALGNFGLSGGSALVGVLEGPVGYQGVLFVLTGLLLLTVGLLLFVDLDVHLKRLAAVEVGADLDQADLDPVVLADPTSPGV